MRLHAVPAIWLSVMVVVGIPSRAVAQSIDIYLERFFKNTKPELFRDYNVPADSLRSVGVEKVSRETVETEIQLYGEAMQEGVADAPSPLVLALCQNLLIHDPSTGRSFLQVLNHPTDDVGLREYLQVAAVVSGESGERMAIASLKSIDPSWRMFWSEYLRDNAMYESSVPEIGALLTRSWDPRVTANLLRALGAIGSHSALDILERFIGRTKDAELQSTALTVYTEIAGAEALPFLENLAPAGSVADAGRRNLIQRIRHDSTLADRYELVMHNDIDPAGMQRLASMPSVKWLAGEGLLRPGMLDSPDALPTAKKNALLDSLAASRGLGIWMVKGTLARSLDTADLPRLLEMRSRAYYSPGTYSAFRVRTIAGLIRYVRQRGPRTVLR